MVDRIPIRAAVQERFPVPANDGDTDGAFRALGALAWLEQRAGVAGPVMGSMRRAVEGVLEGRPDEYIYYLACRLGASVSALALVPEYRRVLDALPARDAANVEEFWHDEVFLFAASQLRATGLPLTPLTPVDGVSDPDAFAPPRLYLEVKHRPRGLSNAPKDLGSFIKNALNCNQIRKRDRDAIGIIVVDLGQYDVVNEDDFLPVDSPIYERLRRSKLLHAVVVTGQKRGGPFTWIFLSEGVHKRTAMPPEVMGSLRTAFPYGTMVSLTALRTFGVVPS